MMSSEYEEWIETGVPKALLVINCHARMPS